MVQIANPAGNFPVLNGSLPCEGTKAFPFNLDFITVNAYKIDLTQQQLQKQFTTLQTVWIDNADNPDEFELICTTTGQRIVAPAQSQGFYAMLQPSPPVFSVQTSGSLVMEIILLNFYIPPQTVLLSVQTDIPSLDAIISNGGLNTNSKPVTITGMNDASGVIAAGGTWQNLFAASALRERFMIFNPDTATETLYFRIAGGGPIPMLPGGGWDESGSTIAGDTIQVMAATTDHAFTAYSK